MQVQDDVNPHVLRMLEGTFSPGETHGVVYAGYKHLSVAKAQQKYRQAMHPHNLMFATSKSGSSWPGKKSGLKGHLYSSNYACKSSVQS